MMELDSIGNATSEDFHSPKQWALIVGMGVTTVVLVVGTAGNLLTLCTLAHQFRMPRRNRFIKDMTADTVLITNLALADLCYSAINIPFVFVTYFRISKNVIPWEEDSVPCKVSAFLRYTNAISEWTTLGLMALERCVNIYKYRSHQKSSRWFTPQKTTVYCAFIWIIGVTCQLPTLFELFGKYGYNYEFVKCDFVENNNTSSFMSPRILFFALESMVPCILILIGYIVILVQVHSASSRLVPFLRSNTARQSIDLRRSRTTRVIIKLLLVYLLCVIPICGYNIAVSWSDDKHPELGIIFYCIYWCQYFINNFIYVVSNERYRNAYCQFIAFILCREIPLPIDPARTTATCRRNRPIYSISCGNNLQIPSERIRTISELEESRHTLNSSDYQLQQDSCASSICLEGSQIFPTPCPSIYDLCNGTRDKESYHF